MKKTKEQARAFAGEYQELCRKHGFSIEPWGYGECVVVESDAPNEMEVRGLLYFYEGSLMKKGDGRAL